MNLQHVDLSSVSNDETQSTKTLVASVRTIQETSPLTFSLENVGGCPSVDVLRFLDTHLPQYTHIAFRLDALDYGSASK